MVRAECEKRISVLFRCLLLAHPSLLFSVKNRSSKSHFVTFTATSHFFSLKNEKYINHILKNPHPSRIRKNSLQSSVVIIIIFHALNMGFTGVITVTSRETSHFASSLNIILTLSGLIPGWWDSQKKIY